MARRAVTGPLPPTAAIPTEAGGAGPVGGGRGAATPSLLSRLERAIYHRLVRFLARRFAWEALVSRDPDSHYRVYARLLERIDGDMTAEDAALLRDHPLPRRGHLTIVK